MTMNNQDSANNGTGRQIQSHQEPSLRTVRVNHRKPSRLKNYAQGLENRCGGNLLGEKKRHHALNQKVPTNVGDHVIVMGQNGGRASPGSLQKVSPSPPNHAYTKRCASVSRTEGAGLAAEKSHLAAVLQPTSTNSVPCVMPSLKDNGAPQ